MHGRNQTRKNLGHPTANTCKAGKELLGIFYFGRFVGTEESVTLLIQYSAPDCFKSDPNFQVTQFSSLHSLDFMGETNNSVALILSGIVL